MLRFLPIRRLLALGMLSMLAGCAMHSTATHWNGHAGPDGEPVFVLNSTYLGLHLFGMIPLVGDTTIDEMIGESTKWILAEEGSRVRLIETESNNYWYGVPPLSWLFSPVMASVTIAYKPSDMALAKAGVKVNEQAAAQPQR